MRWAPSLGHHLSLREHSQTLTSASARGSRYRFPSHSASRPASGVVFASPGASAWKSSYQAMADGSDGVGQVKKVSRRKRSVQQESQSAVRPAYFGASMAPRVYFGREQENASPQGSKGYMPGYTGHAAKVSQAIARDDGTDVRSSNRPRIHAAPRARALTPRPHLRSSILRLAWAGPMSLQTRTQSIEVSQHHNSVDKSLLLENYRHNVPGYSGFYK